jgi:hypothetical protein
MKKIITCYKVIGKHLIISLIFFSFLTGIVNAQKNFKGEISKTYQFTLKDGSVVTGKIVSISENEITISSGTMGEVRLKKININTMTQVSSINEKVSGIWFPNPNPSRYLLSNSAIPLEKNSGYYQNTWIFLNSFSYAFTNNLSISGGFEIFSLLAKEEGPYAFYINPKISFKAADNFYAGGSVLYANTFKTVSEFGGLGTFNFFATYGNNNNNITAALGWGWADGGFSSKPLVTISGMARLSKRIALVSENWLIPGVDNDSGYYGIISYGVRFLGEKTSIDLAFINNKEIASEIGIGIPWLDFVVNF